MPRGERINTALRCTECENPKDTYVIRTASKEKMKAHSPKKYCPTCRKHVLHKTKEIKGGY